MLKRAGDRRGQGVLQVGELRLDPVAREVRVGERKIDLSAKEFALLRALAAEPTRVFTKEALFKDVCRMATLATGEMFGGLERYASGEWGAGARVKT